MRGGALLVAVALFTVGLSFILGLLPRIEHSVALARQQRRALETFIESGLLDTASWYKTK